MPEHSLIAILGARGDKTATRRQCPGSGVLVKPDKPQDKRSQIIVPFGWHSAWAEQHSGRSGSRNCSLGKPYGAGAARVSLLFSATRGSWVKPCLPILTELRESAASLQLGPRKQIGNRAVDLCKRRFTGRQTGYHQNVPAGGDAGQPQANGLADQPPDAVPSDRSTYSAADRDSKVALWTAGCQPRQNEPPVVPRLAT